MKKEIKIKRVYEPTARADGARVLVDRLWPRGLRKEDLHLTKWAKDASPSPELRKWFGHDAKRWPEFRKRYWEELETNPDAWSDLVELAKKDNLTLLFSAKDAEHNNAVVLKEFLENGRKFRRSEKS